jgi:spore coat polysaccharide biosynthesis protein SpsF
MKILGIVQARMNSRRFPGKVLAPFRGRAIIAHVCAAVANVLGPQNVVVATSQMPSDDPLAAYLGAIGVRTFRGPLDDVLGRFVACVASVPCDAVLRVSADSPLIESNVISRVVQAAKEGGFDLVTTTFPRTFPKGTNAEVITRPALQRLAAIATTPHYREHVTAYAYEHPSEFLIRNVESGVDYLAETSVAVDTVSDLERLETLVSASLERATT